MKVTLVLLFAYALSCGIATWLENDFGVEYAKAVIYGAFWFDILHFLLTLNLLGIVLFSRMWSRGKKASFLLHCSFLLIVLGAGITRYFGVEGECILERGRVAILLSQQKNTSLSLIRAMEERLAFQSSSLPNFKKTFFKIFPLMAKTLHSNPYTISP